MPKNPCFGAIAQQLNVSSGSEGKDKAKGKAEGEVDKHRDKYHFQLELRTFELTIPIIPPFPVKMYIQKQELSGHKSSKEYLYTGSPNRDVKEKKKPIG